MLDWRLKEYRHLAHPEETRWQNVRYAPIDTRTLSILRAQAEGEERPKSPRGASTPSCSRPSQARSRSRSRSGLSGVAVDAVSTALSVATTFKEKLAKAGVIFCSFSEACGCRKPSRPGEEVSRVGLVPYTDNFFATLNSAVFSDGSFRLRYVPKGVRCPMELCDLFAQARTRARVRAPR